MEDPSWQCWRGLGIKDDLAAPSTHWVVNVRMDGCSFKNPKLAGCGVFLLDYSAFVGVHHAFATHAVIAT
ncbi:hypothetical protein C5167_050469 [Papaver somniferum]|uniref:Uncharacterized protein n=1 Tax=Papaver somniferum TaxID=3469 RepID=A0A4Y7KQ51_PAPSO|nr:hypothetical protein C5167_050469 [Papaver somniferum]